MRTKTLFLSAALGVVGVASAFAQSNAVYSVNAVGYVNKTMSPGFTMIANPLVAGTNTVASLFAGVPEGTTLYTYSSAGYTGNAYEFGEWSNPTQTLLPGEGAFILNNTASPFTITFVGEVMQGVLSNSLPSGFSIRSSKVPQQGRLQADLGYTPAEGDVVYQFGSSGYTGRTYEFGEWSQEPVITIAESFFVFNSGSPRTWVRNFSVNNN